MVDFLFPKSATYQIQQQKFKISFSKTLKNKCYHAKVLPKRFHLNDQHRISSTDSKVRTTLHVSIVDSGSEMVDFLFPKSATYQIQQQKFKISFSKTLKNKCYHAKVLPKRFHLNDQHRISSTDSKVRTTLHVSIVDSGSEMVDFLFPKSATYQIQQQKFKISFSKTLKNKCYHAKVLPKRFHLNGDIIRF